MRQNIYLYVFKKQELIMLSIFLVKNETYFQTNQMKSVFIIHRIKSKYLYIKETYL